MLVLKACTAEGDLKTLEQWADYAGLSYSSLCECCRLVGIRPRDARDFARVLRAILKAHDRECDPGVLLDVSDRRTLKRLLDRSGIPAMTHHVTLDHYLKAQRFVTPGNVALQVVGQRLRGREHSS